MEVLACLLRRHCEEHGACRVERRQRRCSRLLGWRGGGQVGLRFEADAVLPLREGRTRRQQRAAAPVCVSHAAVEHRPRSACMARGPVLQRNRDACGGLAQRRVEHVRGDSGATRRPASGRRHSRKVSRHRPHTPLSSRSARIRRRPRSIQRAKQLVKPKRRDLRLFSCGGCQLSVRRRGEAAPQRSEHVGGGDAGGADEEDVAEARLVARVPSSKLLCKTKAQATTRQTTVARVVLS